CVLRAHRSPGADGPPFQLISLRSGYESAGADSAPQPGSLRVLVLAPAARPAGLGFRRSVEQEAEVRGDEWVGRRHRVGVVDSPVLARESDPARILAQAVLELGPGLLGPLLEKGGRVVEYLRDLGNLLCLLRGHRQTEVEWEVRAVRGNVRELPAHPLLVGNQPLD